MSITPSSSPASVPEASSPSEQTVPSEASPVDAARDEAAADQPTPGQLAPEASTLDAPAAGDTATHEPALDEAASSEHATLASTDTAPDTAPRVEAREQTADRAPFDCAAALKQRFPALFGGPVKPLKLKIQTDIQQRAPGAFSKAQLSAFFRRYTGSTSYLIAVSKSPHRFDLDGAASGDVSDEHRQAALDELARRRANHQAKIEQQEDARRKRAALLRDFETTTLTPANFCVLKGIAPQALDALLDTARREAQERQQAARAQPGRTPQPRMDAPRGERSRHENAGGAPRRDRRPPQGKGPAR